MAGARIAISTGIAWRGSCRSTPTEPPRELGRAVLVAAGQEGAGAGRYGAGAEFGTISANHPSYREGERGRTNHQRVQRRAQGVPPGGRANLGRAGRAGGLGRGTGAAAGGGRGPGAGGSIPSGAVAPTFLADTRRPGHGIVSGWMRLFPFLRPLAGGPHSCRA